MYKAETTVVESDAVASAVAAPRAAQTFPSASSSGVHGVCAVAIAVCPAPGPATMTVGSAHAPSVMVPTEFVCLPTDHGHRGGI